MSEQKPVLKTVTDGLQSFVSNLFSSANKLLANPFKLVFFIFVCVIFFDIITIPEEGGVVVETTNWLLSTVSSVVEQFAKESITPFLVWTAIIVFLIKARFSISSS